MKLTPDQLKAALAANSASKNKDADISISLDEIESFGNKDSLREIITNISKYNAMLKEKIPLINDALSSAIPFTKENLYLFCAYTGSGKSTIAANITYPLWQEGKKTLVISNEESEQDVLFRIACLHLGLNFNDYKKGFMSNEQQLQVISLFPEITKFVKVLDVSYKDGMTTKIEGVKKALEAVKKEASYSCVLIDYFQLIKYSLSDPKKTAYENLNDLRVWLGQYIKSSNMPIVLFAQLYSLSKKGGAKDLDARIKDCSAIVEPATVIIEAVPNFEAQTTDFYIAKDRFGRQGTRIVCAFEKGRYVKISQEELVQREMRGKLKQQESTLNKLEAMAKNNDFED